MADALGFEPPAGLAEQADLEALDAADQPATDEDREVLVGEQSEGDLAVTPSPDDEPL
jgi:hypothetical protein